MATKTSEKAAILTPEEFAAAVNVSRETLARLKIYADLLITWQAAGNLVAAASLADLWRRHMLDSAQISRYIGDPGQTLADLGSGAGFPGLVLAIMGHGPVHLIESNGRKCAFLRAAAEATGAAVDIHHARAEDFDGDSTAGLAADIVVARACAPLPRLLELAAPLLADGGRCLFHKGRNIEGELTESQKTWMMSANLIASLSDPSGRILHLGEISRRHGK